MTFDMDKALNHLQEQLSTSLRALSKPRQQTVTELVDSVRQQIVGDDCAPCATHNSVSGEDVQLLEPLGEGTVRAFSIKAAAFGCWFCIGARPAAIRHQQV